MFKSCCLQNGKEWKDIHKTLVKVIFVRRKGMTLNFVGNTFLIQKFKVLLVPSSIKVTIKMISDLEVISFKILKKKPLACIKFNTMQFYLSASLSQDSFTLNTY